MSLLCKVKRRRKCFVSKRVTQLNRSVGAARTSSPAEGTEDADGDEYSDIENLEDGQLKADDEFDYLVSIPDPPDGKTGTSSDSVPRTDASSPALSRISPYVEKNIGDDGHFVGDRSSSRPRFVRIAKLFISCVGAFYIGRLVRTFCIILATRVFLLYHSDRHCGLQSSIRQDSRINDEIAHAIEGKEAGTSDIHYFNILASHESSSADLKHMESASDPKNTQVLSTEADEDIRLLENRKQLKRLNCMKLPPSVSFLDETLSEPPSAKSSPKAWLQRAGSSVLTGSPDLRQAMLKSKGIFRTKKKKEPQSVPSSPLCTDAEATSSCSIVTDESDSEKSVRPVRVFRKSKFRPVLSRSNEMDATEKNIGILDQGRSGNYPSENVQIQKIPELFDSLIMKKINKESDHSEDAGKRKGSNKGRDDNVAGAGKGKMKMIGLNKPFSENEGIHAQSKASNARSLKEIEKSVFFGTGKGPVHRTGGMFQSSSKPSTIATSTKARSDYTRSATGSLLRPSVRREGRSRQQIVSIGNAWLAAGLTIIMAGLLKGRIIAMAGLICYWYILSFCRKRYNIVQS